MFNILLSTARFHLTPYPIAPTPPIPVAICYLRLSVEFKITFLLFPHCRAEQLISMVLINHFLMNCSLNHSTQTGDLEELFQPIYSDIKGLLWALPSTLLPSLSPTECVGFGLCIHISPPSVSFSPFHFDDTLLPPWEGKQLGLCLHRWTVTAAMKLKETCSLEEKLWQT